MIYPCVGSDLLTCEKRFTYTWETADQLIGITNLVISYRELHEYGNADVLVRPSRKLVKFVVKHIMR